MKGRSRRAAELECGARRPHFSSMTISKLKSALLATAVLGVSATAAPVFASDPAPLEIVQPAHAPPAHAADEVAPSAAKKAGLIAAGAAVLAALGGLIGWKRLRRAALAAGPVLAEAARSAAKAPAAVVRAAGAAMARPFRFAAFLVSFAAFALFGVWLYDVEWLGGLAAGAAGVAAMWMGSARLHRFARALARRRPH